MDIYSRNISQFNNQLRFEGLHQSNFEHLKAQHYDVVVVAGMGGSGLPREVLWGLHREIGLEVPVINWHDYGAPKLSFRNPLYVFISFSGNTEEVISAFHEVGTHSARAVVTGGGTLFALAEEALVPVVRFAQGALAPRQATGVMSYALCVVLQKAMPHVKMPELSTKITPAQFRAKGSVLAKKLKDRIVFIYAPGPLGFLAHDWKIRINENAKTPSHAALLPELDHNEIAGFQTKRFKDKIFVLFLLDKTTDAHIAKRAKLTQKVLSEYNTGTEVISLAGATMLEKTWNSILFAEWTSYFLAKENGVDPFDTELIEKFKKLMK